MSYINSRVQLLPQGISLSTWTLITLVGQTRQLPLIIQVRQWAIHWIKFTTVNHRLPFSLYLKLCMNVQKLFSNAEFLAHLGNAQSELLGSPGVSRPSVRPSCDLRRLLSTISINNVSSQTPRPVLIKLDRDVPCTKNYQSCSKNSILSRTLLNGKAQSFNILCVSLPSCPPQKICK